MSRTFADIDECGAVLSAIAQMLRQQTAATHLRVENGLALLDPALTTVRLADVLARFYGFWAGTEPVLERWAQAEPGDAVDLDWPRRRRSAHLRADLLDLGLGAKEIDELPVAPAIFDPASTADVLGWLYVSEGSTLGGAVISRHLDTSPALRAAASNRLRTFAPYAEGPAPMWRVYLTRAAQFTGEDVGRISAVVAAAVATFDALADWLAPLMAEVAA